MDCSAAEGMVNRYINRTLSPDELERFLNHVGELSGLPGGAGNVLYRTQSNTAAG